MTEPRVERFGVVLNPNSGWLNPESVLTVDCLFIRLQALYIDCLGRAQFMEGCSPGPDIIWGPGLPSIFNY